MDLTYLQFLYLADLLEGPVFTAYKKATLFDTDAALANLLQSAFFFLTKNSQIFLKRIYPNTSTPSKNRLLRHLNESNLELPVEILELNLQHLEFIKLEKLIQLYEEIAVSFLFI